MPTLVRGTRNKSAFSSPGSVRNQSYNLVKSILDYERAFFNRYRRRRSENYLLMNNNGKTVLGFAFLNEPKNNAMPRLSLIGTKQGKGYGKQIMNAIYANAKKEGWRGVYIKDAIAHVQPFYRKLGYKNVSSRPGNMQRFATPTSSPSRKRKRNSPSPNRKRN